MSVASLVHARLPSLREVIPARRVDDVDVLGVPVAHLRTLLTFLRDDADVACDHFVDLTVLDESAMGAVQASEVPRPHQKLVILLCSRFHGTRVQVDCLLDGDEPAFPSLTTLWPAAFWAEREVWDLFGVVAEGHPFLRRLLLPDERSNPGDRPAAEGGATSNGVGGSVNQPAATGARMVVEREGTPR
jgi:NADH:ubiquinone oxidoreductase subunit C